MKKLNKWAITVGIIVALLTIVGMSVSALDRFATKKEVISIFQKVDKRLDRIEDLLHQVLLKRRNHENN